MNNDFLMQFQSDMLNIDIIRPKISESTALGAAFISGLSVGFFKDLEEIKKIVKSDFTFTPVMARSEANYMYNRWIKAVEATRLFK